MGEEKDRRYLEAFEGSGLHKHYERYCIEKFVRRFLQKCGIETAGDLLALDGERELELFLVEHSASEKVQERALYLYGILRKHRDKIVAAHVPRAKTRERKKKSLAPERECAPEPAETPQDRKRDLLQSRQISEDCRKQPPVPRPEESCLWPKTTQTDLNLNLPSRGRQGNEAGQVEDTPVETNLSAPPRHDRDIEPIPLGRIVHRDKFGVNHESELLRLTFDEAGLSRHALIAGTTGSGKTVAARFIIEQSAIRGIPSIVIDAQGDISSLVLQESSPSLATLYGAVTAVKKPVNSREERDIRARISKHLEALIHYPKEFTTETSSLYAERCLPRIFTPGRPDLGLPLALPPYVDVLAMWDVRQDALSEHTLTEILMEEVRNLVHSILPKAKPDAVDGYIQLLVKLFRHAHKEDIPLDGRRGIDNLHSLVQRSMDLEPSLFEDYFSEKDRDRLAKAVVKLKFEKYQRWLKGTAFDVKTLIEGTPDGRTPINIINIKDLFDPEDRKRVLRHLIAGVYKFAVQNPKPSGPPSLILYIDEVGTGYGERSIALPESKATHRVYQVLNQLVRQARKYGVAVVLASQGYTDFQTNLRRQLVTKIIGKVDDRNELRRITDLIGGDVASTGHDPSEFVARELPRLAPPLLLHIGVRGKPDIYEQLKCCTVDIVLVDEDVMRWRDLYSRRLESSISCAQDFLKMNRYEESLQQIGQVESEAQFLEGYASRLRILRVGCYLGLGHVDAAGDLIMTWEPSEKSDESEEWVDLGWQVAKQYRAQQKWDLYMKMLKRTTSIAEHINSPFRENLQLEAAKHQIFVEHDPGAASETLSSICESKDPQVSLFAKAWSHMIQLFPGAKAVWEFLAASSKREPKLIVQSPEPLSVLVTKLPEEEVQSEQPFIYTSDLAKRPEILTISKLRPPRGSISLSLQALRSKYTLQQKRLTRARACMQEGRVHTAVQVLEEYFRDVEAPGLDPATRREIESYDENPEIRRTRVLSWIQELDWRGFELEVSQLFTHLGYKAWVTARSNDGGVDVRAVKGAEKVVVQCKHWKQQKVGLDKVQAIYAIKTSEQASSAVLVTSGAVERGAKRWARQHQVEIVEGPDLTELFIKHCDPERLAANTNRTLRVQPDLPLGDETNTEPPEQPPSDLTPRDREVLRLFEGRREIRNKDVQELLGVSRAAAWGRLKKLVGKGYLVLHGSKAVAFYTKRSDS